MKSIKFFAFFTALLLEVGSRQRWRAGTAFLLWSAPITAFLLWSCDGIENGNQDADADVVDDDQGEAVLATLTVESIPVSGAAIEIDDTDTGQVTPNSFDQPVGHYTIQLTLTDYDAAPEEVNLPEEGATVVIELFPSVEGENWNLTYRESTTGIEGHYDLYLEQTGSLLIGWDDGPGSCEYTGSILATGDISLFRSNCGGITRTLTGSKVNPNRMEGNWYTDPPGSSGTWWADRR